MYSGTGDKGETSLFGRRRVSKDFPLVEAYGTIDELNSLIGVIISDGPDQAVSKPLRRVQEMLFTAGADASREFGSEGTGPRITPADTKALEDMTDALLGKLPPLRNFILPGGTRVAAELQLARTVCRRAERRLVHASRTSPLNPELIPFFNRLSSYLFNLSRLVNKKAGKKEIIWKS